MPRPTARPSERGALRGQARRNPGIAGESGCGKSVTSQSILRILPKNGRIVSGQILFRYNHQILDLAAAEPDSKLLRDIRGKEIAMIFQEPMTAFSPVHTIGNQIVETIRIHQQVSREEARSQAIEMLWRVGLPNPARNIVVPAQTAHRRRTHHRRGCHHPGADAGTAA